MSGKKIITVFGATGVQGGSVVNIFLNDPKLNKDWQVRGVTRDVTKDSSKKLASQGVEVVSADMNDESSLQKAMEGSHTVFVVTNYWEKMDKDLEIKQGRNAADAGKAAGVKHFIFSSLINVAKVTNGALRNVHHFDSKAEVEEYIRTLSMPATFFMPGYYITNTTSSLLRPGANGKWTLSLPTSETTTQIPMLDPANTGIFVKAMALHGPDKLNGVNVPAASEYITPAEMLAQFREAYPAAGKDAAFAQVPFDAFKGALMGRGMPEFAAQELLENMRLLDEGGYFGGAKLDESLALLGEDRDRLVTWRKYLKTAPAFKGLE